MSGGGGGPPRGVDLSEVFGEIRKLNLQEPGDLDISAVLGAIRRLRLQLPEDASADFPEAVEAIVTKGIKKLQSGPASADFWELIEEINRIQPPARPAVAFEVAPQPAELELEDSYELHSADDSPAAGRSPRVGKQESMVSVSMAGGSPRRARRASLMGTALDDDHHAVVLADDAHSRQRSERILKRYEKDVENADKESHLSHLPLAKRESVKPDAMVVAKSLKSDMDGLLKRAGVKRGSTGGVWESLFTSTGFKQQLQFLEEHSRTGHFTEHYGDGEGSYDGEFLYGRRHGKGTHAFRGEVYDGDWKWDLRHGWGVCTLPNESQIRGEWQGGKPHGFVTILDKAGGKITYEGEFRDGKRSGLGRQVYESGDSYDGGWKAGRLHDRGIYYFANGDKMYGMWDQGVYHGIGVFRYADGSASRRVYKEGLLMSVQDYDATKQRYGRTLSREEMLRHTKDTAFPQDIFMITS